MDLEQEMQVLLHEEIYIESLIEKLSQVVEYNNLQSCTADAQKLLKKLYSKKETLKSEIDTLADDMVSLAEAYVVDNFTLPESEFYFDSEE